MDYTFSTLINLFILVPVAIGCVRLSKMDIAYFPFVFLMMTGLLHELVSSMLIYYYRRSNISVYNTYTLLESILIVLQFWQWSIAKKGDRLYLFFGLLFLLFWTIENFLVYDFLTRFNSYFIIFYSFIIVVLSINKLNSLIVSVSQRIVKHPMFIICLGFIIFFTYSIIVEIFWLFGFSNLPGFAGRVYDILAFINLLVNILFVLAILWIPPRQTFILQSS